VNILSDSSKTVIVGMTFRIILGHDVAYFSQLTEDHHGN